MTSVTFRLEPSGEILGTVEIEKIVVANKGALTPKEFAAWLKAQGGGEWRGAWLNMCGTKRVPTAEELLA